MRRRVRHTLEARDAGHIHDVCLSLALDQVDAVQVDTERTAAAQRDVGLLGSRGERLAVLLRLRAGREDLPDAEEPLADHVDLQVAPLGRVIALCQNGWRLVRRACLGEELGLGVDDAHAQPAGAVEWLDDGTCGLGVRVVHTEAELLAEARPSHKPPPVLAQRYHPPEGRDLKIYVIGERLFGVRKVFPARTEAEKYGEPFAPTAEQADIALRCGRAFGIDLYGVDLIESEGKTYVVDMSSIPGFKGVPDAPSHLASYFYAAAERAASGRPVFQPAVEVGP